MINSSSVVEINSNGGILASIKKPSGNGMQTLQMRNLRHTTTQKDLVGRFASPMARGGGSIERESSAMKTLGTSNTKREDPLVKSPARSPARENPEV